MIALLIGTIGLMGSLAIQQVIVNGTKASHDSSVALRLASQKSEELASRPTDTYTIDVNSGLAKIATSTWSSIEYLNAQGKAFPGVPANSDVNTYRWRRQWRVTNLGESMPYNITVVVLWMNEGGEGKTTRLDVERRKAW